MIYKLTQEMRKRLDNDFKYHPPAGDQIERYAQIRHQCHVLALFLTGVCPPSRELSLALTHLEEVSMFANASIARNELPPETSDHETVP